MRHRMPLSLLAIAELAALAAFTVVGAGCTDCINGESGGEYASPGSDAGGALRVKPKFNKAPLNLYPDSGTH